MDVSDIELCQPYGPLLACGLWDFIFQVAFRYNVYILTL